jgi:hypothetical protein
VDSQRLIRAVAFATGVCAKGSHAQPAHGLPTSVFVAPAACGARPWSVDAWSQLLRVELAGDHVDVHLDETASVTTDPRISVDPIRCEEAATSATLTCRVGDVRRTRAIDLIDVAPIARPRVVAMAVADLVRSCTVAIEPTPAGSMAPAVGATDQPPQLVFDSVAAGGEARVFARGARLFGPSAGIDLRLRDRYVARLDGAVLLGRASDPLGTVDVTVAALGASVLATAYVGRVELAFGPRGEAGIGWFTGHAASPPTIASAARSPLVFFSLSASASWRVANSVAAVVGLDAGTTVSGFAAQADQRHALELGGPLASVHVSLAWPASRR